jgi:hypothetical protein
MALQTTIYAKSYVYKVASFPPIFPFLSSGGQDFVVVDRAGNLAVAQSGTTVFLIFDLSSVIGQTDRVANVSLALSDAAGVDGTPSFRRVIPPRIIGNQAKQVRQIFAGLVPGGQYVATLLARTAFGQVVSINAPFPAAGNPAVPDTIYVVSDTIPPQYITSEDGIPVTVG